MLFYRLDATARRYGGRVPGTGQIGRASLGWGATCEFASRELKCRAMNPM